MMKTRKWVAPGLAGSEPDPATRAVARMSSGCRRALLLSGAAAATALVAMSSAPARATTGAGGLQEPHCKDCTVNIGIGTPFNGRFYMAKEGKASKISAARIDVSWSTEYGNNDYLLGEVEFRRYNAHGVPETVTVVLYPWRYVAKRRRLSAALVPLATVSEEDETGVPIGELSFKVPPGITMYRGTPAEAMGDRKSMGELKVLRGHMSLEGASYPVEFVREDNDKPPSVAMPVAKRVGKLK